MVPDGPFGWNRHSLDLTLWALGRLDPFVQRTWHEILSDGRSHSVTVSEIPNHRVSPELARIGLGDVDHLVSLRLGYSERMWGWRQLRTLSILWFDPGHDVWP